MRIPKKFFGAGYWIFTTAVIVVGILTVLSSFGWPNQYRIFVVQSGSMEPAVKVGSLIIASPANEYKKGDIITFRDKVSAGDNTFSTVTHRVEDIVNTNTNKSYITKGDANNSSDLNKIKEESILGKVNFHIAYLGYPVGFAKTQTGFMFLIIIPATLIVYSEILKIKKEACRLIKEKKVLNIK